MKKKVRYGRILLVFLLLFTCCGASIIALTARSANTGGAGLGLAIAKEITELHGGTISTESGGGKTTFTVTLPV